MIPELIEQARKLGYDYIIFASRFTYFARLNQATIGPNRDYIELRGGAMLLSLNVVGGVPEYERVELDTAIITAPFELIRLPKEVTALTDALTFGMAGVYN